MAKEVIFPKVDMDMEAGTIIEWLKSEGDKVIAGEPLFVIETDKASMEIEAPGTGFLSAVAAQLNTPILVGKTVAWITQSKDEIIPGAQPASPANASTTSDALTAAPKAADTSEIERATSATGSAALRASPAARRTARELSIDLGSVQGSALRGRIIARDVQAAANQTNTQHTNTVTTQTIAHSPMRKNIAARLQAAVQQVPAFQLSVDIDCEHLINTRIQHRSVLQRRSDSQYDAIPTINDYVVKALALALQDFPMANCSWDDDTMHWHSSSDIAIAVSVTDGVLAPIIRRAETKSLQVIATESRQLAERAREKKLAPMDYQGGASTVSNLGMYGVRSFSSIIVPPQSSIVSIGAVRETATVKEGQIRIGKEFTATFTFDHRVIDGVPGAELASGFKYYLENPIELLID